ncbi:MAG: single-stranded DNA-binding protein [Lachnospiraceae bacterium]|nr:single-stranded DNA-binding protein [Lachnospiraceae bacterium]MDU2032244.1 single-stranded DNA-binding protein [Lachnospiraceae bacterium]
MLAFSNDYYGFIFRATQSVELFCAYVVANFRIAVDRKYSDETDFFPCTAFGWLAEFVEKYLYQGIKIVITGRMENNNYTNKDGDKVYGVRLCCDEIEFAESKNSQDDDEDDSKSRSRSNKSRQSSSRGRKSSGSQRSSKSSSGRSGRNSNYSSGKSGRSSSQRGRSSRNDDVDEQFDDMDYEEFD